MAIRLIDLSILSERESQDIRTLLSKYSISFYETPKGNWSASMTAIWISDERQLEKAQALLSNYRNRKLKGRIEIASDNKNAIKIQTGSSVARRVVLALLVAGIVVLLAVVVSLIGDRIPLGRNFDARGGKIELLFLLTILFLICVAWALRYFVERYRKKSSIKTRFR